GLLDAHEDVVHLTMAEAREGLAAVVDGSAGRAAGIRRRAARRKADFERFAGAAVPYEFGGETPPPTSAAGSNDEESDEENGAKGGEAGDAAPVSTGLP